MLNRLNPFRLALIILLTQSTQLLSQGFSEYAWGTLHPIAALKVKKAKRRADAIYDSYVLKALPDSFASGGKLDAFRHVFYMAVFTQKVRVKALRKLGQAHEKSNLRNFKKHKTELGELADEIFSEMDLLNNELGFSIGSANKNATRDQLAEIVLQNIAEGKAKIILRNCNGKYVSCSNLSKSSSGINVSSPYNKCLVDSNQNCVQ